MNTSASFTTIIPRKTRLQAGLEADEGAGLALGAGLDPVLVALHLNEAAQEQLHRQQGVEVGPAVLDGNLARVVPMDTSRAGRGE